ncbi:DUF2570 family protein [Serratia sp. JSRIV006]|uniref:DUF2570 family protein n=1 Tax=Serratia sp. JSRIV006 TaxID=2831896 RepID=UPI001CBC982F|nr:DUF2570 family protein [Serratia sp. JSRIV006]UAN61554.1 DUF2570 family protein [Serratia sp. JSRIV006]
MTPLSKYGLIGALLLAILLGCYAFSLSDDLDVVRESNVKLVKAVESRDETINALKGAADSDRRATEAQLKIEQQKRVKADAENRTLREALEHSGCNQQRLPDDALRILRRENAPASP